MTINNIHQGFRERLRYPLHLAAGLLVAAALLFVANWEADEQERVRMEAFRGDVGDMAQISETIIADRLRKYDDSLLVLRAAYTAGPTRFTETIRLLRRGPLADGELLTILVDRDGFLAYTDTPNVKPRLYLGDRKYFRYFANGGKDRLYIDEPAFGRVTQRYILPLVRPVYDRQGSFLGVIAISVKQESLGKFGPQLRLSEDTAITVVNHGGAVISRSHNYDKMQGTNLPEKLLSPMLKGTEGVFQGRAVPDGAEQIIAYRHINTDLIVYAEASPAKALRAMAEQRAVLMWIAGFTSLIVMVLIVVYLKGRNTAQQLIHSLRKNREREYETLTGTSLDGFWICDCSGRILDTNETFCKILGYSKEELLGLTVMDVEASEAPNQIAEHIRATIAAGNDRFQSRQRRKDGTIIDVEISAQYLQEPEGRFFVFIRDITERKQAEENIRKQESHYRSLFDNSLIGVTVLNKDAILIEVNDAFCKMLGYAKEEFIGKKTFVDISHPDDLAQSIAMVERLVNKEIDRYSLEKRYIAKSGKIITALIYVRGLYESNGAYGGLTASILDITEHKRAEEEKRALEQQMQHTQKLESLGVLSGGIAHDFNNILAVIIGYCGLTKMNYKNAEKNLVEIEKAAERAAGLCRQMLAYAGKAQLAKTRVNMSVLVDEMVQMLKSTLPQNTVIKSDLLAAPPLIDGDASQLRQIVMNLVINASEAIGKDQGEIRVALSKATVIAGPADKDYHGKTIPPGIFVCLEVTDNGCGMDEETRWRIFEPFYTTKFTGRGLGMSATLGIVMSHGGALQLFSQVGQGTTFKVYLPVLLSEAAGEENPGRSVPATPWQGSGTVLLVEDGDEVRHIAHSLLDMFGFAVVEAVNGKQALALYHQHAAEITLVFTDLGMPIMDGYELFRELKKFNPELPIIISSGFGDVEVSSRIANEDIAGLISKPYNAGQLREVLKRVSGDTQKHE